MDLEFKTAFFLVLSWDQGWNGDNVKLHYFEYANIHCSLVSEQDLWQAITHSCNDLFEI